MLALRHSRQQQTIVNSRHDTRAKYRTHAGRNSSIDRRWHERFSRRGRVPRHWFRFRRRPHRGPFTVLTQRMNRKWLMLSLLAACTLGNVVTYFAPNYPSSEPPRGGRRDRRLLVDRRRDGGAHRSGTSCCPGDVCRLRRACACLHTRNSCRNLPRQLCRMEDRLHLSRSAQPPRVREDGCHAAAAGRTCPWHKFQAQHHRRRLADAVPAGCGHRDRDRGASHELDRASPSPVVEVLRTVSGQAGSAREP